MQTHTRLFTLLILLVILLFGLSSASALIEDLIFKGGFETLVDNKPPVADAGTRQVVYGGGQNPVLLTAERSTDPDGKIVSTNWQVLTGPVVVFAPTEGKTVGFLPPVVSELTTISFQATVTDNGGLIDVDTVSVDVLPAQVVITAETNDLVVSPQIRLLDQDGNVLETDLGNPATITRQLPAGVYYAVGTAASAIEIDLKISGPNGPITGSIISAGAGFLLPAALDTNILARLPYAQDGAALAGPPPFLLGYAQIVEFTLDHPQTGLRDPNQFLEFLNKGSARNDESAATAEVYYKTIDPADERLTLDAWLLINGFTANGDDAHAIYQNDADLGFGRDMHARLKPAGEAAAYVRNYPSLDHALANEKLIATVTMEYTVPLGGSEKITTFYAYGPNGKRLLSADLDGRGAKFIPGACNICHGGRPKALVKDDLDQPVYPDHGDTDAQFLPWDLETFVYSELPALTRVMQEGEFKALNEITLKTYPPIPAAATPGKWTGKAARDLIEGWYVNGPTFDPDFIPAGWAGRGATVEELYSKVVGPNCRACHVMRGTSQQHVVDLDSYEKFKTYAPLLKELVYERGVMPVALRTFGHFWEANVEWQGRTLSPAQIMAEVLDAELDPQLAEKLGLLQANGVSIQPGRPSARTTFFPDSWASSNRVDKDHPDGTVLDARDSLFATSVEWLASTGVEPVTPVDLQNERQATISFPAGAGQTDSRVVRQIVPPASVRRFELAPSDIGALEFFTDIRPLIVPSCTAGCHSDGGINGIPVKFDGQDAYEQIIDRLDFVNPLQSLMLSKAGGLRHGRNGSGSMLGSAVSGWELFDANGQLRPPADRGANAQKMLTWMQQGTNFTPDLGARSCRQAGVEIPDNDTTGLVDQMEIGQADSIENLSVYLRIDHSFLPQLEVSLTHLDTGASATLLATSGIINCERDNINAFITSAGNPDATKYCVLNPPPIPSPILTQAPASSLSVFNGDLLNGSWQLRVSDNEILDTGVLLEWCIRNGKTP